MKYICITLVISLSAFSFSVSAQHIVRWTDLVGTTTDNNGIVTKTAADSWTNSGATSSNYLEPNTDGWIEFAVTTQTSTQIGFVNNNFSNFASNAFTNQMSVGSTGIIYTQEGSVGTSTFGNYTSGDVFRISREGSQVKYYRNGGVIRTVSVDPSLRLWARVNIYATNQTTPVVTASFDAKVLIYPDVTGAGGGMSSGGITTTVAGGKSPYTYSWSSGETTSSISNKAAGTYTLTVTDADGRQTSQAINIGYKVTFGILKDVTESAGRLTKTTASGWNGAGSDATNTLSTDGWIEFVVTNYASAYVIGFDLDQMHFLSSFRNCIYVAGDGNYYVYELSLGYNIGKYRAGDVFRIAREGANIKYYRNGAVFRTVAATSSYHPVKAVIADGTSPRVTASFDATVRSSAVVTGTGVADGTGSISLTPYGGIGPYTYSWSSGEMTSSITGKNRGSYTATVTDAEGRIFTRTFAIAYKEVYTTLTQATVEPDGRIKRTGAAAWLGGANTSHILTSNGWVEWVVPPDNSSFAIGFQNSDATWDYNNWRNGFVYLGASTGQVVGYEAATPVGISVAEPGDVMRLDRTGTTISYSVNGTVLRTTTIGVAEVKVKVAVLSGSSPRFVSSFGPQVIIEGLVTGTGVANNSGAIATSVSGGTGPYVYSWSSGEITPGLSGKARGPYTLTVSDAEGRQTARTYNVQYKNSATELTNAVPHATLPGFYTRTTSPSGANSANIIPANEDGWIEWVHYDNGSSYQAGYSLLDYSFGLLDFHYSITIDHANRGNYSEFSGGLVTGYLASAQHGDVFRVAREGNNIKYYRNGVLLRTVATNPTLELRPKFVISNATIPAFSCSHDATVIPLATVVGTGQSDGTGSITVTPAGGTAPYSYLWAGGHGAANTITNKNRGDYTVTVTDSEGRTAQRTYGLGYRPLFANTTLVVVGEHSITKTGSYGWDGGATSSGYLASNTDGWVEMIVPNATAAYIYRAGFSYADGSYAVSSIRNGFEMTGTKQINAVESGSGGGFGNILPGDVLRIKREGSNVKYYRNGVLKRTVTTEPSLELHWKAAISTGTVPMFNASFDSQIQLASQVTGVGTDENSGAIAVTPVGGKAPYSYAWTPSVGTGSSISGLQAGVYSLVVSDNEGRQTNPHTIVVDKKPTWTDLVGVNAGSGYGLVKTTGPGWNAGAVTVPSLAPNKDGWIEFVIPNNSWSFITGFSTTLNNYSNSSFKHGVHVDATTSTLFLLQDANAPSYMSSYQVGDVIRVDRTGTNLTIKRNGSTIRVVNGVSTSTQLRIKTAINLGGAPPVASSIEMGDVSVAVSNFGFQYQYDNRKRMVGKKLPGAEWVYMVYDNRDRLVLTQDGNQRTNGTWTFTKYDELNRSIATGIKDSPLGTSREDMQEEVDEYYENVSPTSTEKWAETRSTLGTAVHGYTNVSFPQVSDASKYLTITYYDDYEWQTGLYNIARLNYESTELPGEQPAVPWQRLKGVKTGSKVKVLDGSNLWLYSVDYFDDRLRLVQSVSDNIKGGTERVTNSLDFVGKVMKSRTTHTTYDVKLKDKVAVFNGGHLVTGIPAGPGWGNSGAASVQTLAASTDGWVEATVPSASNAFVLGLSASNPNANMNTVNFGILMNNSQYYKCENCTNGSPFNSTASAGDVIKVERTGSQVKYYKNGSLLGTSGTSSSGLLLADMSFYYNGASLVNIRASFAKTEQVVVRTFGYDHAGRLKKTWHKVNGGPNVLLAANDYNELGQLVDKKVHSPDNGVTGKQSVDYRYNIRGWLTSINDAELEANSNNNDMSGQIRDLFGMNLLYNDVLAGLNNDALYNGNISAMRWSNDLALDTKKQKAYRFSYDTLNRIKQGDFYEKSVSWGAAAGSAYSEKDYKYDLNGNIRSLKRYGGGGVVMDNLGYDYGEGASRSNRLLKVSDVTGASKSLGFVDGLNTSNDYTYDANGNMVTDANKSVSITYNMLNLVSSVTRGLSSSTLGYVYDATGRKHSQIANYWNLQRQTDYVGEFQYEDDVLQSIQHEEGRVVLESRELIYSHDGSTTTGITNTNSSLSQTGTDPAQTYVRVDVVATATKPGAFPIGGSFPVQGGERYLIRARGWRPGGPAYIWVKTGVNVNGSGGTDLEFRNAVLPGTTADAESWVEAVVTIPGSSLTLMSAGVVFESTISSVQAWFFLNEFEIHKIHTLPAPEYQYNLKDHLGNVRMTFTSAPEADSVLGTLETPNLGVEQGQFLRYENARRVSSFLLDHTGDGASSTTIYSNDFSSTTSPFIGMGTTVLSLSSGRLKASQATTADLVTMTFTTIAGHNYKLTFDIDLAGGPAVGFAANNPFGGPLMVSSSLGTSGTYTISFTAQNVQSQLQFQIGVPPSDIYLDNILIEDVSPAGVYAQRLNGSENEKYGLARSLQVLPGDTVRMEVYAKYIDTNSGNWNAALTTLMNQVAAGSLTATRVDGAGYTTSTSSFPFAGLLNPSGSEGGPKAYLNWLVFDRNFALLDGGFKRLSAAPKETGQNVTHERLFGEVVVKHAGFVYVYFSNEETSPVDVYFDDFKVEHIKSSVIESQDYYPFGLAFNSYTRENETPNQNQYNGKEVQDELNLGWIDYGARMYMPDLGRWSTIDPLGFKFANYTPYNYAIDNPVVFIDPNGMESYKYDWDSQKYVNSSGEEVSWSEVEKSLNDKPDPTNIFVTAKDRKKEDGSTDWALEGTVVQARASGFRIFEVENSKDAYEQLKAFVDGGESIGNVIFDSHGTYNIASFKVGNGSPVRAATNQWVRKLGELFSDGTEVLLLACHSGAAHNGGTRLLESLSNAWGGATVYGNQSWTAPAAGMFWGLADPSHQDLSLNTSRPNAVANYGKWSVAQNGLATEVTGSLFITIAGAFQVKQTPKPMTLTPKNYYH